jgi:2-oxoglutarate ferredoxin oxidoreductase subunit beta
MKTTLQFDGVVIEQFNPIATAITVGATFVGRVFSGDVMQAKEVVKAAIQHQGYALVDVFQPCVVYNKQNTYQWFKEHTYALDETHDKGDKLKALEVALDLDRLALGVIYEETGKPIYDELVRDTQTPLFEQPRNDEALQKLIENYT